ncbi:NADH-quinone oxidoreductase subunit N [Edaphobacter acidisoli]|uniref:NADH-quinone oxidoreductase subunit N n=1 Tax=Edaphobacter acidisoli TaxID=2040573 RepID=A0A916RQH6_9BACT|nr:NADH-quinone oxidoreductase subunit N [Edaphobacter acidisoli]GGA65534.1 NADH-quinone oxidoreductase subunit N [Edaphobacter acidisoli]
MTTFPYIEMLYLLLPEIIITVAALCVLSADLTFLRKASLNLRTISASFLTCIGCALSAAWILHTPTSIHLAEGMLVVTPAAQHVQIALLVITALASLLYAGSTFTEHVSEYLSLMLLATVGMMLLVSTQNLLVLFLALELLSLSLYVLAAFNKSSTRSSEAALKYFLFGGISAAFLLFGFSLLYGLSNSTDLAVVASSIHTAPLDPLLIVAFVMVLAGLGFKVAAAPFHFWAPDVYQGAPAPSAALIASGSKVASFFILYQVMAVGLITAADSSAHHSYASGWAPAIAIIAVLSMLLGNLAAIMQTSVRRLLAYSAIGHAGYMLLAILAHTSQSFTALLYYAITYALTVLGAFGVIAIAEKQTGGDTLTDFAGFSRRAPIPSFCMLIFLLSLAGIPPLAGFFGKFYLFASVLDATPGSLGLLWLVILAIAMSAVSLYYYLKVLKSIYVADPPADAAPAQTSILHQIILCVIALGVVLLGCMPSLLLRWL